MWLNDLKEWATSISIFWLLLLPAIIAVIIISVEWRRLSAALAASEEEAVEAGVKFAELTKLSQSFQQHARLLEGKYSKIINVDKELENKIEASNESLARATWERDRLLNQIGDLKKQYEHKKGVYDHLVQEVAIFDERLAFAELGVYQPHFDFSDSEHFKSAILFCREQQKVMVSADQAVVCRINWTVDGSATKGATMTKRGIKLTLRAFNNECEAAISNTRWNNVNAMERRIIKAQEQIDKLNASNSIAITDDFVQLRLEELYLTHEYREKLKTEKEERAELARAAREEQKLQRDIERAEQDKSHYQKLLERARTEAERAVGEKLEAVAGQVYDLERHLAEAQAKLERAQSLAEKTKCGYVYIISNLGSFGEGIVKIGVTRRLDPQDRVRELGDASVPFGFDVHAIIYSEDAPALERALHNEFESGRVNVQNPRKEFFRATLEEVEAAVGRIAPSAPFFKDVEAQEYRETLARRHAQLMTNAAQQSLEKSFPASL